MANLLSVAQEVWEQLNPKGKDEAAIELSSVVSTAKREYAYQSLLNYWQMKQVNGEYNIPGGILDEQEVDVTNNEADISDLDILKALPDDMWLQNLGGIASDCQYIKSDVNKSQLLQDDDSMPDNWKPYYIVGQKIKFPKGAHKDKVSIIFATNGERVADWIELDDSMAGLIRRSLLDVYKLRIPEDKTNNTNSER